MNNPIIKVENVSKAVDDRQLLLDVSFSIDEQSLVSLIGPNGAGKSTLLKIILGFDKKYTGTVTVREKDRIQYIPQLASTDQYQLPISVREYLNIGTTRLYSQVREKVDLTQALEHVGVNKDKLSQPYKSLSGGERQRIAIARALLADPKILVLDEPLAAVDHASRAGLYELIRHLQQDHKMTVLLVSHDTESVLPLSDRVLCLNQTLHSDCHPTKLTTKDGLHSVVHHHC
tara:strand:+ start:7500 stop:8192 length:693 start_codon:yes stop_codon:yes gene_type:complete